MPGPAWVTPVVLEGSIVRLEPLSLDHLEGLNEIGLEPEIWRWFLTEIATPADMRAYVDSALAAIAEGTEMPFTTIERATGRVIGGTRFLNIDARHRRLEIGYTWLAPSWQRTAVNTEAKLLQLTHAFDVLGALRVEFKTDSLNEKSRAALRGIGAVEEGTLRNHMITDSGRRRDSVYFSITAEEWPLVRENLVARLARRARPAATD